MIFYTKLPNGQFSPTFLVIHGIFGCPSPKLSFFFLEFSTIITFFIKERKKQVDLPNVEVPHFLMIILLSLKWRGGGLFEHCHKKIK